MPELIPPHIQRDPEQDLKEYQSALDLSRRLSINANRFHKSKRLLLFGVLEKDEQNLVTDELGNDITKIVGTENAQERRKLMTKCQQGV